jgi:DNA-binding transcriptional regulator YiaG
VDRWKKIEQARKKKGITTEQVARYMCVVRNTYRSWETGKEKCSAAKRAMVEEFIAECSPTYAQSITLTRPWHDFSSEFKFIRRKYKISQEALADRLLCCKGSIKNWERGVTAPNVHAYRRFLIMFWDDLHLRCQSEN